MSAMEARGEGYIPPWTRVIKPYRFQTPWGLQTFAQLFNGRALLIVQHFSLAACTALATDDSLAPERAERVLTQFEADDIELVAVSRAQLAEIEAFKRQMGWQFRWVSSNGSDFNYDYHVTFHSDESASDKQRYNRASRGRGEYDGYEVAGTSLFYKDASDEIFHAYSVSQNLFLNQA